MFLRSYNLYTYIYIYIYIYIYVYIYTTLKGTLAGHPFFTTIVHMSS